MASARAKANATEIAVAAMVVTREFFSIGKNLADVKTSTMSDQPTVKNRDKTGNTTVTARYTSKKYFRKWKLLFFIINHAPYNARSL